MPKRFVPPHLGEKFNKLTYVSYSQHVRYKNKYYHIGHFRCECGEELDAIIWNVRKGNTKSCGCLYKVSNKNNRWGR